MRAARQSHEKRRRGAANRTFSPHHCILHGERRPFPRPTRPKTPKVCAITLTTHVAPKQALNLPGIMQTGNGTDSPARSYSAYFWAFSNYARPTRPRHRPGHPRRQRRGPRRRAPSLPQRPHIPRQPPKGQATPSREAAACPHIRTPRAAAPAAARAQNAKGAPGPLGPDAPFLIGPRPGVLGRGRTLGRGSLLKRT